MVPDNVDIVLEVVIEVVLVVITNGVHFELGIGMHLLLFWCQELPIDHISCWRDEIEEVEHGFGPGAV